MVMKSVLYQSPNIEIRKSPIHGYGVFATTDIPSGSLLEECTFIPIPEGVRNDYVFWYPRGGTPNTENHKFSHVVIFGYGSLYNHGDNANATWTTDIDANIFLFHAQLDIKKNEEILIYYGDENYWSMFPNIKKL